MLIRMFLYTCMYVCVRVYVYVCTRVLLEGCVYSLCCVSYLSHSLIILYLSQGLVLKIVSPTFNTVNTSFNSFAAKLKNVVWDYFHVQYNTSF